MHESRTPRVLVVDDDPAIRLVCMTNLRLDGYDVIEASNGQEALELALAELPDVVLLDLSMPVLDGFAVAAALRADERTRQLPLVILTGETGPTIADDVEGIGAAGYFTKPFEPRAIAAFIGRIMDDLSGGETRPAGGHAF